MTVAALCRASRSPASIVRFSGVATPGGVARASQRTSHRQHMNLSDVYRCIDFAKVGLLELRVLALAATEPKHVERSHR